MMFFIAGVSLHFLAAARNGLKNVEKRLKLLFEENYIFDINSNLDKFDVYLKVPVL